MTFQVDFTGYYKLNSDEQKSYLENIRTKIKEEEKLNPMYSKMLTIAERTIKNYMSDFLVHDYNEFTLYANGDEKYIWNVYNQGSRLVKLDHDFVEESESSLKNYNLLKKHYFYKNSETYLVNLGRESVTSIDPEQVTASDFTNRLGKVEDYFRERINRVNNLTQVYDTKRRFDELLRTFNNHPPKKKVDELFLFDHPEKQYS